MELFQQLPDILMVHSFFFSEGVVDPEKAGQLLCAESLSRMFGLDLQRLLELAGDIHLFKGSYVKAIELYKLARVSFWLTLQISPLLYWVFKSCLQFSL